MEYFWYTYHELADDVGFSYFGVEHLTALAIVLAGIVACSLVFVRLGERGRDRMLKGIAVLVALGEVARDVTLACVGHLDMEFLPLHLCSFAIVVFVVHAFMPDSRLRDALGEISWCLLMPGSLCALLFPNWTAYPMLNFMNLHSFFWHALIALYPVLLLLGGRIRPRVGHWWYAVVFLAVVVPPIYAFDVATGYNYFFVNFPSAGTPLATLYDLMGEWWRVGYAALALVVILVLQALGQWLSGMVARSSGSRDLEEPASGPARTA